MKITPIYYNNFYNNKKAHKTPAKVNNNAVAKGMSYPNISFGWCEKHNVRSKEISLIFLNQLQMQNEKENNAKLEKNRLESLDIADSSHKEALNFLLSFSNRQKNEAEFIPLWSLMNDDKLKTEMDKSKVFSDPIVTLMALSNIPKLKVNNKSITKEQLEKANGSLQIHTAIILINQIKQNMGNKKSLAGQNDKEIMELVQIVIENIEKTYGAGTYEKFMELSRAGATPDFSTKKESLDFLLNIDNDAKRLEFGDLFDEKLTNLLEKQRQLEFQKNEIEYLYQRKVTIGEALSEAKVAKLEQMLANSVSEKEKLAAQFMLEIKREIRFDNEKLDHDNLHHKEHLIGKSTHTHTKNPSKIEVDEIDVHYHEHSHDGHSHTHKH